MAGLVIETNADGLKRCTGVKVWDGHQMVTATATREVALSAGSIGSAHILQLAGIGDAQSLHDKGVAAEERGIAGTEVFSVRCH